MRRKTIRLMVALALVMVLGLALAPSADAGCITVGFDGQLQIICI